MSEVDSADMGPWLSPEDFAFVSRKVPLVYVDVVPVRTDEHGTVVAIGMMLNATKNGIMRAFPSGRVLYHERVRDALYRHIEKDLGPMALPQMPHTVTPFTVGEYFPTPGTAWYDERHHAVSLAFIIPMQGECNPGSDSLEFTWFTPAEAATAALQCELSEAHASLLRQALAHLGHC